MYLAVYPRENTIYLHDWRTVEGKRVRQTVPLKRYEEPGRAKEVLQKARRLPLESVIKQLVGAKKTKQLLKERR